MKRFIVFVVGLVACGGGEDKPAPLDTGTTASTAPDAGCETPGPAVSNERFSLMVGDMERAYRMTAPSLEPDLQVPLLLAFNGADGNNYPFPQEEQFSALAESDEAIVVYPVSELVEPNEGEWQLNTTDEMHHDIDFVEAMIEHVAAAYCIDRSRIYATGYSLGSMFTYELPCHLPHTFAAIASHAGTMPVTMYSCDTSSTMGILHIHGQLDDLIDYDLPWDWKEWDSVGTMLDIPGLIDFWQQAYACDEEVVSETDEAEYIVHSGCTGDVRVEHIGIKRGGHDWPSTIDGTNTSSVVWDFVSSFDKESR